MYPDAMFNFATAANKMGITIDEVLDLLDLTVEDAEAEDLTVYEIIEACEDCGFVYQYSNSYYSHA